MKPKIIVLTGPTAAGKTGLSIKLARKFDCEIISADSRQVYRGMDVGTDKIKNKQGIPHHLLDVASPKRTFTVARWKKQTETAIKKIVKKGKVPMVVGGTAFYIEVLIFGLKFPEVKPNKTLRSKLNKKPPEQLFTILQKLDPTRAQNIDKKNKVRLIRAIEIAKSLGKVPKQKRKPKYDALVLGLSVSEQKLRSAINRRVDRRFDAIVREIKGLRRQNLSFKRLISFGLEYRFISYYIQDKLGKKQAAEQLKTATRQFARRQKTFFKRLPIIWIKNQREAEAKIKSLL